MNLEETDISAAAISQMWLKMEKKFIRVLFTKAKCIFYSLSGFLFPVISYLYCLVKQYYDRLYCLFVVTVASFCVHSTSYCTQCKGTENVNTRTIIALLKTVKTVLHQQNNLSTIYYSYQFFTRYTTSRCPPNPKIYNLGRKNES